MAVKPTPSKKPRGGSHNSQWGKSGLGGGRIEEQGYILVYRPDDPNADSRGYVREYRAVKKAPKGKTVHHKDGNKNNNSASNLEIVENVGEHNKKRKKGK